MRYISQCNFTYNDNGTVVISGQSKLRGTKFAITVKTEDLNKYNNGMLMQDAFPYLTNDQRELLTTGLNKSEWNEIFGKLNN